MGQVKNKLLADEEQQAIQDISLADVGGNQRMTATPIPQAQSQQFHNIYDPYSDAAFTPRAVQACMDKTIIGQEQAKRAAALLVFNTYHYGPSNLMMIGETGCGKTEIWRQLAGEYPGMIQIADASNLTAEGWRGGIKISALLGSFPEQPNWARRILVLDEFDKVFDQKNSDTDYYDLIQDQLLKIFDHDHIAIPNALDPANVSIVCLGAFSRIFDKKRTRQCTLGFNSKAVETPSDEITTEDLIEFGLKPELIARFRRIVQMEKPTLQSYQRLARLEIQKLEQQTRKKLIATPDFIDGLALDAMAAHLGGRYIRNAICRLVDDHVYNSPWCDVIDLNAQQTLCC